MKTILREVSNTVFDTSYVRLNKCSDCGEPVMHKSIVDREKFDATYSFAPKAGDEILYCTGCGKQVKGKYNGSFQKLKEKWNNANPLK